MSKFATDPTPQHFTGEDVIGDDLYSNSKTTQVNRIPVQLLSKLQQFPIQNNQQYIQDDQEEINIPQPVNLNYNQPSQSSEVITKNIKINLEINLKINVI